MTNDETGTGKTDTGSNKTDAGSSKGKQQPAPKVEPEEISLNVLIKFIKQFDGTREKLNPFLSNCKNAYSLAAQNQKNILFKYILSQLVGKAETACSIKEFENWDQLSEFLKTQFGERKHYAHLLADLQDCQQLTSETVSQFALKIETCLSKLLTEVTLSNAKKSELVGRVAAMEDLALHTFILGLSPKISNIVRSKEPSTLNKAINFAISEEKIQRSIYKRYSPSSNYNSSQPRSSRNYNTFKPTNIHNVNSKMLPNTSNQSFQPNRSTSFCRYCKGQGHTIEVCKKREYNNNRFKVQQPQPSTSRTYDNSPNKYQTRVHHIDNDNYTPTHDDQDYDDNHDDRLNDHDQSQSYDEYGQSQSYDHNQHRDHDNLNA